MSDDLSAHARALIDANLYLTIGTVRADGQPWTTPVYFSAAGDREFLWASATDAEHSRHIAQRPEISMLVFDSTVPPYHGRAVYALGRAEEVPEDALDAAIGAYPRPGTGAAAVTRGDVTGESGYRLYRARVDEMWVLCPREPRQPCTLHGLAKDHRTPVHLP